MSEAQQAAVHKMESEGYVIVNWHCGLSNTVCIDFHGIIYGNLPWEHSTSAIMMQKQ